VSFADRLAHARGQIARYHEAEGVKCTVQGLTYNATKKLWAPPMVAKKEGLYCSISSLASLRDPDLATYVQTINISVMLYRRITFAYGEASVRAGDIIIKEPVSATSHRYVVVEAVAPDETSPLNVVLHCRKLE
jgi:hypothetical protein